MSQLQRRPTRSSSDILTCATTIIQTCAKLKRLLEYDGLTDEEILNAFDRWGQKFEPRTGGGFRGKQIIDAGSGGSRMHVYEWEPRVFSTLPPPISIPGSHNEWTQRMEPGISSYNTHLEDIAGALAPLIDFAKDVLKAHEENWHKFPVYLKATGGMRELSYTDREAILAAVRDYLGDPKTCPFYFAFDHARVISGEEEGIYGWAAINFLRGQLLSESAGSGTADPSANMTAGTLDLGGASTQISFYKSDQDILANLFKLQIGAQKHWNVYTHSFLQFGLNSARLRMHKKVVDAALKDARHAPTGEDGDGEGLDPLLVVDSCLPQGFNVTFLYDDGQEYLIVPAAGGSDFDECDKQTALLLEAQSPSNNFCQFAFPGQCSVLGTYQPELPKGPRFGRFHGFAGYYKLWQFLNLPEVTSVEHLVDEGQRVCSMSRDELAAYNHGRPNHKKNMKYLDRYCFMSSYITSLLRDGFGFPTEEHITFVDEVGGYKVNWALGSMLYEINALPWSYEKADPATTDVDCPEAAKVGVQAAAGEPASPTESSSRRRYSDIAWGLGTLAAAAVAVILWAHTAQKRGVRRGRSCRGDRLGSNMGMAANSGRSASRYESISDVRPIV